MTSNLKKQLFKLRTIFVLVPVFMIITGILLGKPLAQARYAGRPESQPSPFHPSFPLLDQDGNHVLDSGNPVSTMGTCGACHDADFIVEHSYHASAGLGDLTAPGETGSGRAWDISPGLFGNWTPLIYRYLTPQGEDQVDLTTPGWIMTYGLRHVGGGPAVYSRNGTHLTELEPEAGNVETNILDPESGELLPWDWEESGVVEMNCFLCHTPSPNNDARKAALTSGDFKWANAATLLGTGIIERSGSGYLWNPAAFQENGDLKESEINIQDPSDENCGMCHGLVHDDIEDPLITSGCSPELWTTITTGQIISSQKMEDSGMNLANKEELNRAWDIHAERLLDCTDCHYSLNNPLYFQESEQTRPDHLQFDPRRLEIGEYLTSPLHQFARGNSAQSEIAPGLKGTMRDCQSCHDTTSTHTWLPYQKRHFDAVSCESCHIPKLYTTANKVQDWTVITRENYASLECRGAEGSVDTMETLLTGYQPVLLPKADAGGETTLAPHNMITTWYWVADNPLRPVRLLDLKAAYFENGDYHPGIMARFDTNQDGQLDERELIIDSPAKEQIVTDRLNRLGLENPRIVGEVQAYSIGHNVASDEWAVRDCQACHDADSRLSQPIQLASAAPGGVMPQLLSSTSTRMEGEIYQDNQGAVFYQPEPEAENLYVLGHSNVYWVDLFGALLLLGVGAGITLHGGLRVYFARRQPRDERKTTQIYMYSFYERLWHWLQTASILLLLATGLIIHKPDLFGIFSFRGVVIVHNVLAGILIVNAGLSLFYHLASGEIKQYLPRTRGFFDRSIAQALFYLKGIFRDEEHPFEKAPEKKLNPLQKITYLGLLNVLLPLQIITGALMWGAQRWPSFVRRIGGLSFLAPFHTLVAWLLASFVLLHVYLTTTGHTPLSNIRAMIMGWDEVEVHASPSDEHDEPQVEA